MLRLLLALAALLLLVSCDEGDPQREATQTTVTSGTGDAGLYVNANTGSDTNPGTSTAPFKTITHSLTVATSGKTIYVLPGSYDAANGETFPLAVPAGVTLQGDKANKGSGTPSTTILGTGVANGIIEAAMTAGTGALIEGFRFLGAAPSGGNVGMLLYLANDSVSVVDNTFDGADSSGIYVNGGQNDVIMGNVIINNPGAGLIFRPGALNARVQFNAIYQNSYGVELDDIGGDLGGGPTGSAGGNTINCNSSNDLWVNVGGTVHAMNNRWDHNPPSGNDIFNGASATILLTGFTQITGCPTP